MPRSLSFPTCAMGAGGGVRRPPGARGGLGAGRAGRGRGLAGGRGPGPSARWRQRRVRALDWAVSAEGAGLLAGGAGTAAGWGCAHSSGWGPGGWGREGGGPGLLRSWGHGEREGGVGGGATRSDRREPGGEPARSAGLCPAGTDPQPSPLVRRMGPAALAKGAPCW